MESKAGNGQMRAGARLIDIYNDGLTVFLYDRANEDRIRETDPKIVRFAGREAFEDAATRELLAAGDLLVYGLHGDGGVRAEILVGDALTESEMSGKIWHQPETGFLFLPSGDLCVHSFNTLPMGDNGDAPEDAGAIVSLPPGKYKVTLYRVDSAAAEDAASESGDREDKEIIVLTPIAEIPRSANILFRHCLE